MARYDASSSTRMREDHPETATNDLDTMMTARSYDSRTADLRTRLRILLLTYQRYVMNNYDLRPTDKIPARRDRGR